MEKRSPQRPSAQLDVRAFARRGGSATGTVPLCEFGRLVPDCVDGGPGVFVSWTADGELRGGDASADAPWLHLQANAELPLVCQRCLETVRTPIVVDQWFRFVPDEATAEWQDDDALEDVLVESDAFDLHCLIEDELVLAMPLIASHETCPRPPRLSAQDAGFDAQAKAPPNPFAALARLRKGEGETED